eukprot:XP_002259410.1 hypothetical protein, conserved in Plasmodium species [Plasmodium knowlesi strain H]
MLNNWDHVSSQYIAPPYKKRPMNKKAKGPGAMKNNHGRYQKKYVRNDGERGSKFSAYGSADHNVNVNSDGGEPPRNEDNYNYVDDYYNSDAYYAEDGYHRGDHRGDHYGDSGHYRGNGGDYHGDDDHHDYHGGGYHGDGYHGDQDDYYNDRDDQRAHDRYIDSYNHDNDDGTIRSGRKSSHVYEGKPDHNYADTYDENCGTIFGDHHSNHPRGEFRKTSINEDLSNLHRNLHNLLFSPAKAEDEKKKLIETNNTSHSKNCNESVLNQLSILRNIPFNVKQTDGESGKDEGLTNDEVDGSHADQRSLGVEQKKNSQSSKTAMILDDLKKCLYGSSNKESKKAHPVGENMNILYPPNHDEDESQTERGYRSNSYIGNDDNHFNVSSGRDYKNVHETGVRRQSSGNSSILQNISFPPAGNVEEKKMKKDKDNDHDDNDDDKDDRMNMHYRKDSNYYNSDDMDIESSISSDQSVVMHMYKNEVKEENMITSSGNIFPKNQIAESLRVLNTLQVDIERVCCYIKHFIDPPEQLFQVMRDVFVDTSVLVNSKIAIFYVYNHLIQELRNNLKNDLMKYYSIAEKGLQIFVVPVLRCVLHEQVNVEMVNKFYRCIAIWNERNVYSKIVCEQLKLLQKNPQKKIDFTVKNVASQAHSLLSNELSKFVPISFILKMPSVNNENRKALEDKTLSALFHDISKDTLKGYDEAHVDEASRMSEKVMRMYGQELILINSQILELSSLICDNNDHLVKLHSTLENPRD